MHLFGSICYAYVQNPKKLDDRGEKGIFVGYNKYSLAYLIYFPEKEIVKTVMAVKFSDKVSEYPCSRKNFKLLFSVLIILTVVAPTSYFHRMRMIYPTLPVCLSRAI